MWQSRVENVHCSVSTGRYASSHRLCGSRLLTWLHMRVMSYRSWNPTHFGIYSSPFNSAMAAKIVMQRSRQVVCMLRMIFVDHLCTNWAKSYALRSREAQEIQRTWIRNASPESCLHFARDYNMCFFIFKSFCGYPAITCCRWGSSDSNNCLEKLLAHIWKLLSLQKYHPTSSTFFWIIDFWNNVHFLSVTATYMYGDLYCIGKDLLQRMFL